ncbi:MAG: hypothetical protein MUD01_01400 [Chloroflexaceae bacterium]|jgi:hypothetical protein|nr:hypothetical protein [Chloroflexaceae bacterium]
MSQDLENVFVQLVDASWHRFNEQQHNRHMDELLLGAVITTMVEDGLSLIDLTSDGMAHYLRFEHMPTKNRMIFQLTNQSENLIAAKVLGRYGDVVIGYGERVNNAGTLYQTLKSELKSQFLDSGEPGVITTDADISSGYIYVQVPLILDLDVYFTGQYEVNYALLRQHINATIHSLQKYLRGRLAV